MYIYLIKALKKESGIDLTALNLIHKIAISHVYVPIVVVKFALIN